MTRVRARHLIDHTDEDVFRGGIMETDTIHHYNPSAVYTLLKAARNMKNTFIPGRDYPVFRVTRHGFMVNKNHLKTFYEICDIMPDDYLHILYPFMLAYPYIMRVLCSRDMTISLFKSL